MGTGERESGSRIHPGTGSSWLLRAERDVCRSQEGGPFAVRGMSRSREEALGDWVGGERRASVFSGLRPLHDDVSVLIDGMLSSVRGADTVLLSRLEDGWVSLFGASIASQCRPLSVKDGHVKIEVGNSTFLYVLERQQKSFFLRHLQEFSGGAVTGIEFVPRGSRRWPCSR